MKKSLLILCLLGSLALTLSGCTKEKVVLLNPPENAAQQNMAQIKFSGEVDQDSVLQSAIAFAPDATPKGYFTWKDSMTLEYFLENPDDVKAFSIIFQKPIKDKSGTIIEAPTKIDFFTQSKNTKLLFQVPQDKDQNIQGKAPITLMWSTPVFNLQNAADTKALLGKNITLTPAIEGSWQMLGSTGLLFEPFEAWKPSNQYQVSVSQNLGVEPVSFSFTTPKLEITNIEAQDLIEKKGLDVYFNQEVDLAKIQASLTLSPSIGFDLSYGEETIWEDGEPIKKTSKKIIHLTPRTTWTPQESYTLSLSPGAYSLSGLLPCEAQKQTFTTIDSFGVDRFEPPWSVFGPISLNFSHPVKATDLLASLVIKPGLEKEKWAEYVKAFNFQDDYESRWFSLPPLENETWKAGEDYQITISKNLADTYGRSLGTDFTETFTTSYPNQVTPFFLPTFESVIDKTAQIKPSFKYSGNVESVDIEFKKLFPGSAEWFSNEFLTPSPNQMSFWDLDLRKTFPKILDDNGDIGVGKYEINFTFNITGQNYPSRWGTSFYASDFGVLLKSFTENRIEFSAIDFEGQPIVGKGALMGYDYEGKQVYKDNDTEFPTTEKNLNHVNDFLIQIGDQSGIGSRNFQRKINPYDGKLNFSPWEYETLYKGVVITDRPLFSPGQKVYLKSLFREKNLSGKVFPLKSAKDLSKAYRIEIQDPFWKTIGEFKGTSLDGSFDDVFEIPADSPLGEYQVQVFIGDQQYFNTSFHIQKFRKPKFLIQSEFDSNYAIEKETVTAKAKAEYAFGGALKGRKIVYTASLFGQEPCTFWDFWCPQRDKVIVSGEGILGRDGSFELPIKLELEKDETEINWSLLNFTVTVEASADEKSSQTISIPFSPSSKRITLDYGKYFYYPGDEAKVSGSVTDLEGKALENQKVSLGLYKTKWVRNDRKGHDGDFYGEWEKEDEKISEQDIKTNAKGIFEINLVLPQEGGDYFFQVTTLDDKNRVAQTQRNFWIAGKEPTAIRQNEDNKILQLFSDQEDYNIGEKVEIFFPLSDFEVTYARATLERGDILEELEVDLEKNIITLQTEDWMAPNVFVSLFVQGQNKEDQIDIRWGALEIPVKDPSRKLEVKLDFDKTLYRPGEEVTIEIQTNVEDKVEDKGVPAEVTIAVVDQTLLALKSRPPLNLWQYFLANVPLAVTTTHTLDQFMTKDKMDAILAEADMVESKMMNGFGGGGGDSKVDGDKPRGDFRDTATFLATIKTDQNGKSTQTFTLPDNLTTWNVWAIGHTTENAFGKYESQIKSTLPLLISEIVPNFFHLGDQMQIGLLIRRNNPEVPSAKVTVDLTLPDFFESDLKTQTITVEEEARVFFDIRIPNTPELLSKDDLMVDIGFNIKSESGLKDAITLKRNLTMPVSKLTAAESVQVRTDDSNASQISLIPNVGESLLSKMVIDIYASLANKLDPIIEHIEDLNYGCTEQRFSYVTSLLLQDTLNRNLGNEPLPLDTLNLKEHLDYIQESFQADGFGFWKSSLRPNVWITTHILEYAPLWEKYGLKFDEEKIQNATNYLMTEATRECDENETWWCVDDGTRQHAFYVLTRYDQKVDLDFAAQYTDSLEAKIWWIKTYNSLKRQDIGISPLAGDTYQSFWKELESDLKFRDRYAFWEGGHSFYSQDERTTALIYSEIADHPTLKSFQSKIARYLAETPVTKLSTNSSLYVLQVMGALASQEAENKGAEFVVNLSSADQTAQTITKGTLENLQSEHQYEKVFTKDERGIQKLDLLPANEKSYYADVQLQEIFPSSKAKSISKGFWVEKQIFVLDDDKYASPLTELKLGETYRIRLRVITNTNHRQVRIVDFIPSGSDILNFAFDNVDANLQPKPDQPWYCRGWCQPLYEHHEFHEDRAEFFMDFLGNGTHQIEYLIQTRLPGSFELKPAQAQEMYFPEVFGTSDGMKVEIK